MVSAYELFENPEWVEEHYNNMPQRLKDEVLQLHYALAPISIQEKLNVIWTAYKRSPRYLIEMVGARGPLNHTYAYLVVEYFDWIYAPLIKVSHNDRQLIQNLKDLLYVDGKYSLTATRTGGCDRIYTMATHQELLRLESNYKLWMIEKKNKWGSLNTIGDFFNYYGLIPAFLVQYAGRSGHFMNWFENPLED